ncbi:hypothetical protein [Roseovarius albus]|nr:hypothetical protein [Roseovarius albus]
MSAGTEDPRPERYIEYEVTLGLHMPILPECVAGQKVALSETLAL